MQWRNLKPDQIFEAVKFSHSDKSDNGRFELKVLRLPQSAEVHGIRAFQGHSRDLVSEETDLVEMHKDYYVLCDGYTPTMYARPPVWGHGLHARDMGSHVPHWLPCDLLEQLLQHRCNRPRAGRSDPRRKLGAGLYHDGSSSPMGETQ